MSMVSGKKGEENTLSGLMAQSPKVSPSHHSLHRGGHGLLVRLADPRGLSNLTDSMIPRRTHF